MTRPGLLVRSWRLKSLSTTWSDPTCWWTPAIEAVADALCADADADAADARSTAEMLGRQRAEAGIYLDEARADLRVGAELAGSAGVEVLGLLDALTVGWVDRMLDSYFTSACVDPLTGLASLPYLLTRLGEVYAEAKLRGGSVPREHALVVVQVVPVAAPLYTDLALTAVQVALRAAFAGGETLARVDSGCAVALVRRDEVALGSRLARLRTEIDSAEQAGRLSRARFWLERLPDQAPAVPGLLRQLVH